MFKITGKGHELDTSRLRENGSGEKDTTVLRKRTEDCKEILTNF
jgi:hypothetical protein